jgi:hypothetical protein
LPQLSFLKFNWRNLFFENEVIFEGFQLPEVRGKKNRDKNHQIIFLDIWEHHFLNEIFKIN